jgi:uncharacterized protein YggE
MTNNGIKSMQKLSLVAALLMASSIAFADNEPRTVAVNGSGFAEVQPDSAIVRMSIVARSETVAAAQREAADVSARLLALTDKLKINRKYVDSTGASVRADYRWNRQKEEQELRGYIAERQISVDVRDLDQLGELVEGAVGTGVNQVSPPQLKSSKDRDAYRDALANAAEDARANAAQLAATLGVKLGPVLSINAGSTVAPRPMLQGRAMAMQADMAESAPETYNAGQLSYNATVSAIFELLDD